MLSFIGIILVPVEFVNLYIWTNRSEQTSDSNFRYGPDHEKLILLSIQ